MRVVGNSGTIRRVAGLAAVAALAVGTAGCAGGAGGAGGDRAEAGAGASAGASASAAASPSASPSPVGIPGPGADRLKELLLTPATRVGRYEVSEPVLDEPFSEIYEATPAHCTPLTTLGKAGHTAQAYGSVRVPDKPLDVSTAILLRSYPHESAAKAAMASLAEAGKSCAGGYTEDRALAEAKVLRVEEVNAPAIGDEARAYRIVTRDVKDEKISLYQYLTLVRSGSVTLSFDSDHIATTDFGGVPQEIVTAQWEKFAKGGAS
ncbi:hypothetical protein [Streptomyces sp. RerS4]|uniref:hypothetical protein n=1 Tax=Streptomyces sp. RerS4 TaxID=2942449 RepID=UPI00201C5D67|nr:hypothetical protein [Streptomyces sp. RerS4]UQW99948.1 hypothetical protein M4D82_04900 [Streptomyces sp. RerS4]